MIEEHKKMANTFQRPRKMPSQFITRNISIRWKKGGRRNQKKIIQHFCHFLDLFIIHLPSQFNKKLITWRWWCERICQIEMTATQKNIYKKRRQQKNGTSRGNEKIAMTYVHCSHHITAHHKKEIETNTKKQMKWKIQIIK